MHSGESRNIRILRGSSNEDWRRSLFAIMNMCICHVSHEKGIRVTTPRSLTEDILRVQDLLMAIQNDKDAIIPPPLNQYYARMMTADLLYQIDLIERIMGGDLILQYKLMGIQTTEGRVISRDESDIDMSRLESDMQAEYIEELAKGISDKIVERAKQYKRTPEPENIVVDSQTGEVLEVTY